MVFNYTFRYFDTNIQQLSYTTTTNNNFASIGITNADPDSVALVDGPVVQKDIIITGNSEFNGNSNFTGVVDFESASVNLSLNELTDVNLNSSTLSKGDIFVYSGTNWESLPIGLDDQILTVNSTTTLGLEWVNSSEQIGFEAYSTGVTSSSSSIPVIINPDTIRTSNINISLDINGVITVNKTGIYNIIFRVSTRCSNGNSRSTSLCFLQVDTGSGFTNIPGSFGYLYNRQTQSDLGVNTATVSLVLQITAGDKFQILFNRDNGPDTIETIPGGSGITFIEVAGSGKDGKEGEVGPTGPSGPTGSGSNINIFENNNPIPNSPFEIINFINPITATFNSTITTQLDISYASPVISLYSTTTAIINATPTDLPFSNQNELDTNFYSHSLNSPNITIINKGVYEITGVVSTDGGGRTVSAFVITRSTDGGTNFIDIPGTTGYMYNREANNGENTGVAKAIINLNENDIIKIQARRVTGAGGGGTINFINGGCSLTILKIS